MILDRHDFDPLEVSSDRRKAEIIAVAERASLADDLRSDALRVASRSLNSEILCVALEIASYRLREEVRLLRELNGMLRNAGYDDASSVVCGDIVVGVGLHGASVLLGRVAPASPPVVVEAETDPARSERDELRERMFEYGEMVRPNLN